MDLSKHFKLEEFEKSMTASRKGIKNKAGAGEIKSLGDLFLWNFRACESTLWQTNIYF